jgi:cellulose synthase/poly-beta-1,6-N-acetylglucosamine synthase-like glycosyltransferase
LLIITQVLQFLVLFSFAFPFFVFGSYGLILLYYRNRKQRQVPSSLDMNTEFEPQVSVVTPTHNEASIISKKIENLLSTKYPKDKIELIFVDDSNDSTPEIIEKYSKKHPNIRLIKFEERMGYSPCMFAGVKSSIGDIIVLSDAGSFHDKDTIPNLVKHFRDPKIGAVTSQDIILNTCEKIGKSEGLYQKIYNFVRTAETNMDSTFYFKGEASAVRKDLISDLEECGATFDTAVALFVRQKGFKTIFDPEVKFYEYAPKTRNERIQQKTIRAANWIKILIQFRKMVFNPKYGKFGLFTLPANFAMLIVIPPVILAGVFFLVALTFFDLSFSLIIWSILGGLALLSLVFFRNLLSTFIDFEVSLVKALYEIVFTERKHDQIDTVASTRRQNPVNN